MEGGLLLNIVVRESSTVFELLSSEDEALLVGRDAFFILDLSLYGINCVGGLDLKCDGLTSESLNEDLHSTAESEYQVEGRLLLNIVVRESSTVFELLSGEDEALLVGRDALLVLDLSLYGINCVGGLDFKSDGLTSESLNEDLHVFVVFG